MKALLLLVPVVAACGHPSAPPPAADAPDAVAKCDATPRKLVDGSTFAPSGVEVGVATPALAIAGSYLYYNLAYTGVNGQATPTGHLVRFAVDRDGAVPETVADAAHPINLAVAGDQLWYSDDSDNAVRSVPVAGGTPTTVAQAMRPGWLAHDDASLYFVDDTGIESVPLAGGSVHHLTDQLVYSFGVLDGNLVIADFSGSVVSSMPAGGGTLTPLATGQSGPLYPVRCGTSVCWLDAGDLQALEGTLVQVAASGATPRIVDHKLFRPHGVAGDAAHVFVLAEGDGNTLARVTADGSVLDVLAHPTGAGDVVIDDDCAYWSAFDGLYSVRKDAPAL